MPARPLTLILTCEHAGNRVPARYRHLFAPHRALLASHRGWDPGALPIARALARRLHAPLLHHDVTRLLVETNRSVGHPALFSAISRPLPKAEKAALLAAFYHPHRDRVHATISRAISRGSTVLHVGVHTFTPVLVDEVRNADVAVLYDPARPHERRFCEDWQHMLRAIDPSLRVRRNYPYKGPADGLTTSLRRLFPARFYLGIELEVNQALAASPIPSRRAAVIRAIARSLEAALQPAPR